MINYMSLLALMRNRRSVRSFTDEPVTHERIEQIVEAARWAPSNHHRQAWKFLVFEDRAEIRRLADKVRGFLLDTLPGCHSLVRNRAGEITFFACAFQQAPVVILAMHKSAPRIGQGLLENACTPYAAGEVISTAMGCQNLLLAAHSLGLGACLMTAPLLAGPVWKSLSGLPAGFEPTALIALGHAAESPETPPRKKLDTIIEYRNRV